MRLLFCLSFVDLRIPSQRSGAREAVLAAQCFCAAVAHPLSLSGCFEPEHKGAQLIHVSALLKGSFRRTSKKCSRTSQFARFESNSLCWQPSLRNTGEMCPHRALRSERTGHGRHYEQANGAIGRKSPIIGAVWPAMARGGFSPNRHAIHPLEDFAFAEASHELLPNKTEGCVRAGRRPSIMDGFRLPLSCTFDSTLPQSAKCASAAAVERLKLPIYSHMFIFVPLFIYSSLG